MNIFPTECSFQQCLQFIWTLLSTHWFLEVWSRHVLLKNRNVGFFFPYGKNTSSCVRVSSPFESLCCWASFPYVPSIPIGKKKKTWFIVQKQCLDWCHCSCQGESSCGYPCAPCGVDSALTVCFTRMLWTEVAGGENEHILCQRAFGLGASRRGFFTSRKIWIFTAWFFWG